MTQWRWRYALWYLLLIPLIWPISVFAGWVAKNSPRRVGRPDFPLEANLFLGSIVIVPIVVLLFVFEARAARRFAAIRAQFPRAVAMEFGVSRELRALLQRVLGRRLAGYAVASMVVVISETAIGLHRRVDPRRPELVLRWHSIGQVGVVRKAKTIELVIEVLRDGGAPDDSLILSLPMPLSHSPSPRGYLRQRAVLESALDGIESWRQHRFVANEKSL